MSWALMTATGAVSMWAMRYTPPRLDKILARVAGVAFVAAGLIGATGWLGEMIAGIVGWVLGASEAIGAAALGTSLAWITAAVLGLAWIGAMLPDGLFRFDPPDWLVISGLMIPSLLTTVPGSLGESLRGVTTWLGEALMGVISRGVS